MVPMMPCAEDRLRAILGQVIKRGLGTAVGTLLLLSAASTIVVYLVVRLLLLTTAYIFGVYFVYFVVSCGFLLSTAYAFVYCVPGALLFSSASTIVVYCKGSAWVPAFAGPHALGRAGGTSTCSIQYSIE